MAMRVKSRYEIKEVIARGGMGVVYKAYDRVMKRSVALKTLLDLTDPRAAQLFQKECEDLAGLIHPNIIEIFDVGQLEDEGGTKPYLVMPLLPGVTLEKLIRTSSSRLNPERCMDIFCQTCRGLHAAHERGLIHRDLKPSNIFVMEDDSVKIIDFGVAHRVDTSHTIGRKGTLIYMSPEQIEMKGLTAASDIFSAAVVFYETLTRCRPFERPTEGEVAEAILHYIPPPVHELNPEIALPLSQTIHKATAKNPLQRFRSAREFSDILQKAFRGEQIEIFNPARIRPRLERAREAFNKKDYDFAGEIVAELESEGHLDKDISELRGSIEHRIIQRRTSQLIETARSRVEEREYQIAFQKIDEALQLDPKNTEALALKARIETKRTDQDVDGWLAIARTHVENRAFDPAREALKRILELRPREAKATQLLSEVERMEQIYLRSREEKERLYDAAVQAERNGDISSALSKLERVLEIDKRAPDTARTAAYQRFYDKIRSEHDSVKNAWNEAKRLLDDGRFAQALAICNEKLAKHPLDTSFKALKVGIEEKQRQFISARIAETDRRVEAEPDLERRVNILEEAVADNPGEVHFERALQNARDKCDMVSTIVSRARTYEENEQFTEAIAQWEILQSIYPRFPGLPVEMERLNRRRDKSRRQEAKARWVEQIDQMLASGDYERALELNHMAQEEFPADQELIQLERLAQQELDRHERAQSLLETGRTACERGEFETGLAALREAFDLDGSNNQVRDLLLETLVEQGRRLLDSDPSRAGDLLSQAIEIEPGHALAKSLSRLLAEQRRTEDIDAIINKARELQAEGRAREAREAVSGALKSYPGENRLLQLQSSLRRTLQDLRRRDLENVRRLDRELDNTSDMGADRREQYERRLDRYVTEYADDDEVKGVVHSARRRLETALAGRDRVHALAPGENNQAAIAVPDEREAAADEHEQRGPAVGEPLKIKVKKPRFPHRLRTVWTQFVPPEKTPRLRSGSRRYGIVIGSALAVAATIGIAMWLPRRPVKPGQPMKPSPVQVAISARPNGAEISIDGKHIASSAGLKLSESLGPHTIEASKPGYRTLSQRFEVSPNKPLQLNLTLLPENPLLRIVGSCNVFLDSDPPEEVRDGQPQLPLTPGDHTVRIEMNRASHMSFKVHVDPDGLPVISDITAREMTPLLVSNFGSATKIYSSSPAGVPVRIGDRLLGTLTSTGLDLADSPEGATEILVGDGKDAKKRTIETGPWRTVTAQLEADPNIGTLVVTANQDGATVVLLLNGNEYRRGEIKDGKAIFANARARSFVVHVTKDGFERPADQTVTLTKGQTQTVAFDLTRGVGAASLRIHAVPGVYVSIDGGAPIATNPDGEVIIKESSPGNHDIEVHGRRYKPWHGSVNVGNGENAEVKVPELQLAPGTVNLKRFPPESVITYMKVGEQNPQTVNTGQLTLPAGEYEFSANAGPDYVTSKKNVAVKPGEEGSLDLTLSRVSLTGDPMDRLWGSGVWHLESPNGWYLLRRADAFLGRNGPADVQFQALLSEGGFARKRRLIWVTNFVEGGSGEIRYDLTENRITVTVDKHGQRIKVLSAPVTKETDYSVHLECRPDHIVVKIGGDTVGVVPQDALAGLSAGKFGFVGNKEVRVVNFHWDQK